jgi:hypothetical protein
MEEQRNIQRPNLEAWLVEMLRFTVFLSPSAERPNPEWWEQIVGQPPEEVNQQPKLGIIRALGPIENGNLILGIQPARVDWAYIKPEDDYSIGPLTESLNRFQRLMTQWFDFCPAAVRLAFGVILIMPVADRQAGYRLVDAFLPNVTLDAEGSSDFSYQINRPRNSRSGIEGLRINRLSRWSTSLWQESTVAIEQGRIIPSHAQTRFACRLELDVNTFPNFQGEFTREQVPSIFKELVDYAIEIAREGDIS